MPADCIGRCEDCPYTWCNPVPVRPSKASSRRDWRQDAQGELDDLGDLYDVDLSRVRIR